MRYSAKVGDLNTSPSASGPKVSPATAYQADFAKNFAETVNRLVRDDIRKNQSGAGDGSAINDPLLQN